MGNRVSCTTSPIRIVHGLSLQAFTFYEDNLKAGEVMIDHPGFFLCPSHSLPICNALPAHQDLSNSSLYILLPMRLLHQRLTQQQLDHLSSLLLSSSSSSSKLKPCAKNTLGKKIHLTTSLFLSFSFRSNRKGKLSSSSSSSPSLSPSPSPSPSSFTTTTTSNGNSKPSTRNNLSTKENSSNEPFERNNSLISHEPLDLDLHSNVMSERRSISFRDPPSLIPNDMVGDAQHLLYRSRSWRPNLQTISESSLLRI